MPFLQHICSSGGFKTDSELQTMCFQLNAAQILALSLSRFVLAFFSSRALSFGGHSTSLRNAAMQIDAIVSLHVWICYVDAARSDYICHHSIHPHRWSSPIKIILGAKILMSCSWAHFNLLLGSYMSILQRKSKFCKDLKALLHETGIHSDSKPLNHDNQFLRKTFSMRTD